MTQFTEEDAIFETKMVWMFGSPRSGTTWLGARLLNHHKNIIWNEPYAGVHFNILKSQTKRKGYLFSEAEKKNWLPELKKFILSRAYSHAQTRQKNLVIKEPNGSDGADLLLECFPNSKLIFLLRDGRDVVDSLIDAHRPDSWNPNLRSIPLNSQKIRNSEIEKHAKSWNSITESVYSAYNNHNPNLRLLVKYENLRKNTLEELKTIYQFLKIEIKDEELGHIIDKYDFKNIPKEEKGPGKFFRSATPGSWKEHFSEEEKDLMNSIMGKTLENLNYNV